MPPEQILLDIECQRDFFAPGGSCYTRKASAVAKNIYRLFSWARKYHIPVLSTVLRVRPGEIGPLADVPHCLEGTIGEEKLLKTILPNRINMGLRNSTDLPDHIFQRYQQVIFEKRQTDIFEHARIERLITEMHPVTFVLCGAGIAQGIVEAAVGLRKYGLGVVLATDATLATGPRIPEMAYLRMDAKRVVFAQTADIVAPPARRRCRPFREYERAGRQTF